MIRHAWAVVLVALLTLGVWQPTTQAADADDLTGLALNFLAGLRERGYYDLAKDYLETLRKAPDTPPSLKSVLDYEEGRGLLEEAANQPDLERRKEQLELARRSLDSFTKSQPNHPKVTEALVQLARLLVERGHLLAVQSRDEKDVAEQKRKLTQARESFASARAAYDASLAKLKTLFDGFPKFLEDRDPRFAQRQSAHNALMDATLQRALVDYEDSQTHEPKSEPRQQLLTKAMTAFEDTYKRYRTQLSGLYARMWQAKCYEENGNLGEAMGVYNELMDHTAPELRSLQRQVGFFRIIVLGKRQEFALAGDEASNWLKANPNAQRTEIGLGVRLQLAKNILAQLPQLSGNTRDQAIKLATDNLTQVVRYYSEYKPEAMALLQKYKPKAAASAMDVAKLTYEDALSQADEALSAEQYDRAVALLKVAVQKVDPTKEIDKVHRARQMMAYCQYQAKNYYEAAVLAEHIARRYPRAGVAPKALELAIAAHTMAYNTYLDRDRTSDLGRLVDLARFAVETWPDAEQGDAARMTLGDIALGQGNYEDAFKSYDGVRAGSSKKTDAQARAGMALWRQSLLLREKTDTAAADSKATQALGLVESAYKARTEARVASTDPAFIDNSCDLADIQLASGHAPEALKVIEPLAKALQNVPNAQASLAGRFRRVLATLLRAQIANNQVDMAINTMKTLESGRAAEGDSLTQLYFGLGKLLEKELDALRARGDGSGFTRMQQSYQKFLQALVASKSGQTYESLQWAGESLLTAGLPKDALVVFDRVEETFGKDTAFQAQVGAYNRLARTRMKRVSALTDLKRYDEALKEADSLLAENKNSLDVMIERCKVLEAQAMSGGGNTEVALKEWQKLAVRLGLSRPRPIEYYDAWYHIALLYEKKADKPRARQTLQNVMRLSPTVGSPEMKAKYQELLAKIGK